MLFYQVQKDNRDKYTTKPAGHILTVGRILVYNMYCQSNCFNVDQTTPESEIHVEVIQKPNTQTVLD
jgi:hypothetical protein